MQLNISVPSDGYRFVKQVTTDDSKLIKAIYEFRKKEEHAYEFRKQGRIIDEVGNRLMMYQSFATGVYAAEDAANISEEKLNCEVQRVFGKEARFFSGLPESDCGGTEPRS